MVRLADLPDWERDHLQEIARKVPSFDTRPWASGPPLSRRRVALISTAGLHRREDPPFRSDDGATGYRVIPGESLGSDLVMSHVSVNFDRTGFRQDINVVLPLDRLRELALEGFIGSVAAYHYSFMGAPFPPTLFERTARMLSKLLKRDQVDAVALFPV
jgi:D-proline reductase (dithiol) PrdB